MIKIFSLTPEEKITLKELQKTVKDRWQYVRITTLILIDKGYSLVKTQEILGIDDNSIHRYINLFLNNNRDISSLLNQNYNPPNTSKLTLNQLKLLDTEIENNLYTTAKEINYWIENQFHQIYSENGVIKILHKLGFSYKQTKQIPHKVDIQKQQEFKTAITNFFENIHQYKPKLESLLSLNFYAFKEY